MAILCLDHPPPQVSWEARSHTEKEQACLPQVLQHFKSLEELSVAEGATEGAPLTEKEKFWLTQDEMYRFIRATKCDAKAAIARLEKTLIWRRTHKIDDLNAEYISPEQTTGKQIVYVSFGGVPSDRRRLGKLTMFQGFDNDGRPLIYMMPSRQNTEASWRQVEHVFFILWLCEMLMPKGVETVALMINFADRSTSPSLSTAKQVLFSLQDHYPERLGKARVINLPWVIKGFFKLITPFIDPVTKEKLSFEQDCSKSVDSSHLEKAFGGEADLHKDAYVHEEYWTGPRGVVTLALERQRRMMDKFRQLGGCVGLAEQDLKEGEESWTWPVDEDGAI